MQPAETDAAQYCAAFVVYGHAEESLLSDGCPETAKDPERVAGLG